jgi:hypothetical protein
MLQKIEDRIGVEITKWTDIWNADQYTDAGTPLRPNAGGRISALRELKAFIEKLKNERV